MKPERWAQIKSIFYEAAERPVPERAAFIRSRCGDDESLALEIESLLGAHDQAGAFIEGLPNDSIEMLTLKPGTFLGPYEIFTLLGRGGMGQVYRARDKRLDREVALKVLAKDVASDLGVKRFEQEARAASAPNHPNITAIYDIGGTEATVYIVMELIEGRTLRELLRAGPIATKRLVQIAAQIGDGLAKAHAAGIVHRDLKPENIMLTNEGLVKILDFGLAKLAPPVRSDETAGNAITRGEMTQPGVVLGTVGYMSPEQASGLETRFTSDQFSLGAILYEMATGRRAFKRATAVESLSAIIREEPEPIGKINPQVPIPIRWVIERCLAKTPEDRYACTQDLTRDLRSIHGRHSELEALRPSTTAPSDIRPRTLRTIAAVTLLCAVIVAGVVLGFFAGKGSREPLPSFRQLTFRHGNIRGARLAPDGQTVVYAAAWTSTPADLYIIRPESPQSGPLGMGETGILSISTLGEMAVVLGCRLNWGECIGTLATVPLTGGAPREIMKDVSGADWNPDGRSLAVIAFSGGSFRLQYPVGKVLYDAPGWIASARVSPDGSLVAFLDHPTLGDTSGSVAVVDAKGTKRTVSTGWKSLQGLAWSQGGRELWFTGSRVNKTGSLALYAVTLSGREREVFSSPGTLKLYDISPDGQRILLMRGTPRAGIMSFVAGGTEERDLSWFDYSTVADLSRDGKTLLFYEWGEGVGGAPTVYLRKTGSPDAIRLGEGRPLALAPDGQWALVVQNISPAQLALLPTGPGQVRPLPRGAITEYLDWGTWSVDGRRVFFAAQDSTGSRRTYVQDVEGGEPRGVTPDGFLGALLSPDGLHLTAFDRYGEYYLCAVNSAEDPRPIEGYRDGDIPLQWSNDGTFLYVREAGNLLLRIHKLYLSTGRREFWKQVAPLEQASLIDIGSDAGQVRITPDGASYAYTYWTFAGELYLAGGLK